MSFLGIAQKLRIARNVGWFFCQIFSALPVMSSTLPFRFGRQLTHGLATWMFALLVPVEYSVVSRLCDTCW